jgi:hypothetical protein
MNEEIQIQMQEWLEKVANGCHDITTDKDFDMNLDFYVFQSQLTYNPKLLIIGANPGGGKKYDEMNNSKNRLIRGANDLASNSNQFIEHYDDSSGGI